MNRVTVMIVMGLLAAGCLRVKVDPVEVKPITLNVNLKVDRQLDDFFDFERQMRPSATTSMTTQPAAPVAQ